MQALVEFYRQEFADAPDLLLVFPREINPTLAMVFTYGRLYSEQHSRFSRDLVYGPRWIPLAELADYKKIKAAHAAELNRDLMRVASEYMAGKLRRHDLKKFPQ